MELYQLLGLGGLCVLGFLFSVVFALAMCRAAAMGDELIAQDYRRRFGRDWDYEGGGEDG